MLHTILYLEVGKVSPPPDFHPKHWIKWTLCYVIILQISMKNVISESAATLLTPAEIKGSSAVLKALFSSCKEHNHNGP